MSTPSERTLVRALIRIIEAFHLTPGGRLMTRDLLSEWRQAGLRAEDLDIAVTAAARHGLVREQPTDWGPALDLLQFDMPPELAGDNRWERLVSAIEDSWDLWRLGQRGRRKPIGSTDTARHRH